MAIQKVSGDQNDPANILPLQDHAF